MDKLTNITSYLNPPNPVYTDIPEREYNVARILEKYPDRIPVYVRIQGDMPPIDKHKYLVPKDLSVGQFIYVCRKRIKLTPEKGLFLFFGNILPSTTSSMAKMHEQHKESGGLLVATISSENTFG